MSQWAPTASYGSDMDTIFDLPAHPLLVHIPVLAVPLAALGAILVALRPGWRRAYGPVVVALAALGAGGAVLATRSGEVFRDNNDIRNLGDHAELGETSRNVALLFFLIVVVLVALDRWKAHPRVRRLPALVAPVFAALTVLAAIGATGTIIAAGHSGAERVWAEDEKAQVVPG